MCLPGRLSLSWTRSLGGRNASGCGAALVCAAVAWCGCAGAEEYALPDDHDDGDDRRSSWLIAPYLWGPDFKGSVTFGGRTVPMDVDVRDLASNINAGAMGYLRWTYGNDFVYTEVLAMRWDDDEFDPFFGRSVEGELLFAELGYGRYFRSDVPYIANGSILWSPYVGLRYATLDVAVNPSGRLIDDLLETITRQPDAAHDHWLDPAIGIIADAPLYGAISYVIKLDAAGLGLGRDNYWNVIGTLRWWVDERWSVAAGYRVARAHTRADGDGELGMNIRVDGPFAGISYRY